MVAAGLRAALRSCAGGGAEDVVLGQRVKVAG